MPHECGKKATHTRCKKYTSDVQSAFVFVWEAAGRICTKRLIPFLPEIVGVLERKGHLDLAEETRSLLLTLSAATADRLLEIRVTKSRPNKLAFPHPGAPGSIMDLCISTCYRG